MTHRLLVAGVVSLDITLRVPFIPAESSECFASSSSETHGGAGGNVAALSALYGQLPVGLMARVGSDNLGDELLRRLGEYHVDLTCTKRTDGRNSTRIVTLLLPNQSASYILDLGAHQDLSSQDIPDEYAATITDFYVAPCSPEIHEDLLAFASGKPWRIYFNPGSVYIEQGERSRLSSLLSRAAFVFLNEREALAYSGERTVERAGKRLLEFGPSHIVITTSDRGSVIVSTAQTKPIPVHPHEVQAVNPIGAGDAFSAGFLAEYIRSEDLGAAARKGALFGAYAVTRADIRAPRPDPLEIERFAERI